MPRPLAIRCATESVDRNESLAGTASRVRRWVVLEQPGPWGEDVPVDSRLEGDLAQTLRSRARRAGVRLLLVRRPGWRKPDGGPVAYLAHTERRTTWMERLDLAEPADLLKVDLEVAAEREAPGVGVADDGPVHLVCTNGRHDPCCADLGRPVVKALDEAGFPDVWESSHVGGDRFAANVVVLPLGVYLGRVPPERAVEILTDLRDHGRIDLDHFRGRACYPPLVQSAEIFARRHLGEDRLAALRVERADDRDDGTLAVEIETTDHGPLTVVVRRERGEEEQLTCTANGTARPWRYDLVAIERG